MEILTKNVSEMHDTTLENYSESEPPYLISFFDSWNEDFAVLTIVALSVDIIECGEATNIHNALYDMGENQFIGGQLRTK